jgi:hypothetical protein
MFLPVGVNCDMVPSAAPIDDRVSFIDLLVVDAVCIGWSAAGLREYKGEYCTIPAEHRATTVGVATVLLRGQ